MMSGNPPATVVSGEWYQFGSAKDQDQAKREVHMAVQEITCGKYENLAFFAESTRPTLRDVTAAAEDAVRLGLPLLVLDHFHRMAVPESDNHVATLTETVRRIKVLAVETGLTILMAAQARRSEGLARFMPPNPESGKGTGALEEEADVMLGLFKPIGVRDGDRFRGLTKSERDAYERGELDQGSILQPNTMGVKVLKHRRNGDYSGRIVKLHCEQGLLAPHSGRVA
jgi:replicative DNA helicase